MNPDYEFLVTEYYLNDYSDKDILLEFTDLKYIKQSELACFILLRKHNDDTKSKMDGSKMILLSERYNQTYYKYKREADKFTDSDYTKEEFNLRYIKKMPSSENHKLYVVSRKHNSTKKFAILLDPQDNLLNNPHYVFNGPFEFDVEFKEPILY